MRPNRYKWVEDASRDTGNVFYDAPVNPVMMTAFVVFNYYMVSGTTAPAEMHGVPTCYLNLRTDTYYQDA